MLVQWGSDEDQSGRTGLGWVQRLWDTEADSEPMMREETKTRSKHFVSFHPQGPN